MGTINFSCRLLIQVTIVAVFVCLAVYGDVFTSLQFQRQFLDTPKIKSTSQQVAFTALSFYLVGVHTRTTLRLVLSIIVRLGIGCRGNYLLPPILHLVALTIASWQGYHSPLSLNFAYFVLHSIRFIWESTQARNTSTFSPQTLTQDEDDSTLNEPCSSPQDNRNKDFKMKIPAIILRPQKKSQPTAELAKHYQYHQLSGKRSIRLLSLELSETLHDPLHCQVFESSLDDAPEYTALSYAWGSGTTSVFCNGLRFNVTPNCAKAMRRIREDHEGPNNVTLWIDAICINQGKTPVAMSEKSQQLLIMGDVYKTASRVIAWVGEDDAGSRRVYDFFASVGNSFERYYKVDTDKTRAWRRAESVAASKFRVWPLFKEDLRNFFQRSWFTRMWTIQEVTLPLPGRVSLLCGNSSLPFEYIRLGWQIMANKHLVAELSNLDRAVALQFYLSDALALKRNYPAANIRKTGAPLITDLTKLSLSGVMQATRLRACSDAKDKFFALYGVFQELEIQHTVDASRYAEMTVNDLFQAIFESCALLDGNLNILRLCQSIDEPQFSRDMSYASHPDVYNIFLNPPRDCAVREVGDTHKWRDSLPSFVPDWRYNTHGDADDQDIAISLSGPNRAFVEEYRPGVPKTRTSFKHIKPCSAPFDPRQCYAGRTTSADVYVDDRQTLSVRAKLLGGIASVGTVGSHRLFRQTITSAYLRKRNWSGSNYTHTIHVTSKQSLFASVLNASTAAMIESLRNYISNSIVAPIVHYSQMLWAVFNLLRLAQCMISIGAVWNVIVLSERWLKGNILARTIHGLWNMIVYLCTPVYLIYLRDPSFWIPGFFWIRNLAHNIAQHRLLRADPQKRSGGKMLAVLALLILSYTMPLVEAQSLFLDMEAIVRFIIVTIINIIEVFRCISGYWQEVMGSTMFKQKGSKTTGLTFFVTDNGITGNCSGPLQMGDVLVVIEKMNDAMVLRPQKEKFELVGKAYVGNKSRDDLAGAASAWKAIYIV